MRYEVEVTALVEAKSARAAARIIQKALGHVGHVVDYYGPQGEEEIQVTRMGPAPRHPERCPIPRCKRTINHPGARIV